MVVLKLDWVLESPGGAFASIDSSLHPHLLVRISECGAQASVMVFRMPQSGQMQKSWSWPICKVVSNRSKVHDTRLSHEGDANSATEEAPAEHYQGEEKADISGAVAAWT